MRLNADNTRWITNSSDALYPKKSIRLDSKVFELFRNGDLRVDGCVVWTNKDDFAFDSQKRMVVLDRANGGTVYRSYGALGNHDRQELGRDVKKWLIARNDYVYVLQKNGILLRNGNFSWQNKRDFWIDSLNTPRPTTGTFSSETAKSATTASSLGRTKNR